MAENKKSFILYADLINMVEKLPDEIAGKLFKIVLNYVNDKDPIVEDLLLQIAFEPIKLQLKRDLLKWDNFKEKQSSNGKKGGRPKKPKPIIKNPKNPSLLNETQKSLTVTDTVTDTVTVNDKDVIVNDIKLDIHPLQNYISKNFKNILKIRDQLTFQNCETLVKKFDKDLIVKKLEALENKKGCEKEYVSLFLTLKNWCEQGDFSKKQGLQATTPTNINSNKITYTDKW